jgi:hypothetical protein
MVSRFDLGLRRRESTSISRKAFRLVHRGLSVAPFSAFVDLAYFKAEVEHSVKLESSFSAR